MWLLVCIDRRNYELRRYFNAAFPLTPIPMEFFCDFLGKVIQTN